LVELGENIEKAVIREVKEETCLDVAEPSLIDVVDDVELDAEGRVKYHFVIIDYHLKVKGGVPKAASDAGDLRWVPFGDVEAYDLTSSFRFFFQRNRPRMENLSSCP
jgi:8-oxo-dGTP diphosphatase